MKQKIYIKKNSCLVCEGKRLTKILSLGKTALANAYLTKEKLSKDEIKVPLNLYFCQNCNLVQLLDIVDRKLLFEKYAYFSSASPQLIEHFTKYANLIYKRFPSQMKKLTLEIASNDGILLKPLLERGAKVLGVDPAKNVAKIANSQGIETIPKFFNSSLVLEILKKNGKAGIIIANNVLAHTDILPEIISSVKQVLDKNGVFISQSKYLGDLIDKNEFDTIYHEHICYFSLISTMFLFKKFGLEIFDVELVETEGGSLRFYATHFSPKLKINSSVKKLLRSEVGKMDKLETYLAFKSQPRLLRNKLNKILKKIKLKKYKIAGYGASAKGNTLLQYSHIDGNILDYIVDDAPSKQGLYTPGTHIPIFSSKKIREDIPDYILLITWNFASSIIKKENWFLEQGGRFIIPIPTPRII